MQSCAIKEISFEGGGVLCGNFAVESVENNKIHTLVCSTWVSTKFRLPSEWL